MVTALIGAACAAFVAGVIALIRWMISLSRILKTMQENGMARREEVKTTFAILSRLMSASKATLETLRDGKCNGNVKTALEDIHECENKYEALFQSSIDKRETVGGAA